MGVIVIGMLVILVPLIMVVIGLSLFNSSAESISQSRKEMKDMKAEAFANKFFTTNGIDAPWELYISEFENKFGRKPHFREIKVPRVRAKDVGALTQLCRECGIT